MPTFSARTRSLLVGTPFGEVFPPRPQPPPSTFDGRGAALNVLADYFSELTFYRTGAFPKDTRPFTIPRSSIFTEAPDGMEDFDLPAIGVRPGKATYGALNLNPAPDESSRDVFGVGTVLWALSTYTENIVIEAWAANRAERRALAIGLEEALTPFEVMYGIRFRMPDYFNEVVTFSLADRTHDESDAVRNRRRVLFGVEMTYNVVRLVNYTALNPYIVVETQDNGFDFEEIAITTDGE